MILKQWIQRNDSRLHTIILKQEMKKQTLPLTYWFLTKKDKENNEKEKEKPILFHLKWLLANERLHYKVPLKTWTEK